jgi:hypothetical protein
VTDTARTARRDAHTQAGRVGAASVLRTAGQRRINLIWETTQSFIALSVCTVTLGVAAFIVQRNTDTDGAVAMLSNAFFLVIGFYFGRTNHERSGGVGVHDTQAGR